MNRALSLLFFHCLFVGLVFSYTLQDISRDQELFRSELEELINYRGPILKDIWTSKDNRDSSSENEVCSRLFERILDSSTVSWPPPDSPPSDQMSYFTMGGRAAYYHWYVLEQQNGAETAHWNTTLIEEYRGKPNRCGRFDKDTCDLIMSRYADKIIAGKTALVLGSQTPWAEAALFNAKARHVSTIEYMRIKSDYPNFSYFHPSDIARKYLDKQWTGVDVGFSYSSLEHDGLGRYGDPLNPFGDLESLARIRCLLKPGGYLLLGFSLTNDELWWNAQRLYGRYRLYLITMGWRVIDMHPQNCLVKQVQPGYWDCQPIMLLQKPEGSGNSENSIPQAKSEVSEPLPRPERHTDPITPQQPPPQVPITVQKPHNTHHEEPTHIANPPQQHHPPQQQHPSSQAELINRLRARNSVDSYQSSQQHRSRGGPY